MMSIKVKIPEQIEEWLQTEARRRDVSIEELVREAIYEYRSRQPRRRKLRAAGAGASGRSDISERIEELIAAEWGKE